MKIKTVCTAGALLLASWGVLSHLAPVVAAPGALVTQLQIGAGEIALEGTISSVNPAARRLVIEVSSFTLPSGKTQKLATAKPKVVRLDLATALFVRGDSERKVMLAELAPGVRAIVVGSDVGSGKELPARAIAVWHREAGGVFSLNAPAPAQTSGGTVPFGGSGAVLAPGSKSGAIYTVRVSPDGKTYAAAGLALKEFAAGRDPKSDDNIRVYDERTNRELEFVGATVKLWNAETGTLRHTLPLYVVVRNTSKPTSLEQGMARVGEGMVQTFALAGIDGPIWPLEFSPEGKTLAAGSFDHTVKLWDVETGELRATLGPHKGRVGAIAFSPDGKWIATGAGMPTSATAADPAQPANAAVRADAQTEAKTGELKLWDAVTGRLRSTLQAKTDSITTVAFSPDSKILASAAAPLALAAMESTVTLWDPQTGKPLRQLPKLNTLISTLAFSPNGQLLAGSGGPPAVSQSGRSKDGAPVADQNGTAVTGDADSDGTIRVWTASTGAPLLSMRGHNETGLALAFSPDGLTLASVAHDKVKGAAGINLWNVASGQWLRSLSAEGPLYSVAFAPDGNTLLSSGGLHTGKVQVWNLAESRLERTLTPE